MSFPRRPNHPDFWLMSESVIDQDAGADAGKSMPELVNKYVDLESLTYLAQQRALRLHGLYATKAVLAASAAFYMDAFIQGIRFAHLKDRQTPPENDLGADQA